MAKTLTGKVDISIILGFLLVLGIAFFTMSKNAGIVSNLITLTFPYVLLMFFRQYIIGKIKQSYLLLLILSIILVFVNITLSGSGGFDYYKKAIMYVSSIMWFVSCVNMQLSKRTFNYILIVNLLLIGLYLIFYRQGVEIFEGQAMLTLNFSNPNLTGMFLLHSLLYIGIFIIGIKDITRKKGIRLLLLLVCVLLFVNVLGLLFMTGNRSSLMSLILFAILVIFDVFIRKRFWLKKWVFFLLAIFPFVFVFLYITYAGTIGDTVSFGMETEGKTNTSRNHVWLPIVNDIWHYFIIGDYYGISEGTGKSQLHNTHLDVYASYGIIPLILYICLLFKMMYDSYCHTSMLIQRTGLYAFISVLVLCSFEAALVSGSAGLFLLTGGFLLITNYNSARKNVNLTHVSL